MSNESKLYAFTVEGEPQAWQRAGTRIVQTKSGKRFIQFYTQAKTAKYESLVYLTAMAAGVRPMSGPVEMLISAYFSRPQYMTSKRGFPAEEFPHTDKPDADNIEKGILDGLKRLFRDDCQVFDVRKTKWWAAEGDGPRVHVRIIEHPEQPEVQKRRAKNAEAAARKKNKASK